MYYKFNKSTVCFSVLDVLSSMAEYLIDLDTMTLVTHWKAYAWLTQTYAGDLCSRLEVSSSVSCLTRSICGQLSNLADIVSGLCSTHMIQLKYFYVLYRELIFDFYQKTLTNKNNMFELQYDKFLESQILDVQCIVFPSCSHTSTTTVISLHLVSTAEVAWRQVVNMCKRT